MQQVSINFHYWDFKVSYNLLSVESLTPFAIYTWKHTVNQNKKGL